ncbi:hypothetical protein [Blastomonas fulva]|uniref:hypothetical protein n=1 Tax=Blastomonas fulva TaxID=1550728 RepID=UPI003F6EA2E4
MADSRRHDLYQNLARLGAFEVELDDFQRLLGFKRNGGACLQCKLLLLSDGTVVQLPAYSPRGVADLRSAPSLAPFQDRVAWGESAWPSQIDLCETENSAIE